MAQLTCQNLRVGYDGKSVLQDLSFEVFAGDYLCIVGENGSGKSTLMKTILGLQPHISGRILTGDGLRKNEIGYLPQQTVVQKDFPASEREIVLSGCQGRCGSRPFYNKEEKQLAEENLRKMQIYYVVLTYKTYDGKRKTKWQSTGLPIKGNKRRAEAMMRELQDDFEPPVDPNGPPSKAMLFADCLVQWLEIAKSTVKLTTYASYKELSNSRIIPYFRNLGVTLGDLKAVHIQAFYQEQLERVKPNTVIHYHAVIHRALKYAVKTDLIDVNPADKVDRPKKNEFTGNFYSKDEMNALFDAVRGSKIEVAVMLTAFYGLRRSEVVGLKWAAVDFEQNTIEICHTVTTVRLDGKEVLVESNDTKTKSSKRTLPLVPVFRERLLALQEEQKENRKLCGRCYNKKYADYICVDAMGNLLKPDYLSNSFQIILQNYHLRRIRFHD